LWPRSAPDGSLDDWGYTVLGAGAIPEELMVTRARAATQGPKLAILH